MSYNNCDLCAKQIDFETRVIVEGYGGSSFYCDQCFDADRTRLQAVIAELELRIKDCNDVEAHCYAQLEKIDNHNEYKTFEISARIEKIKRICYEQLLAIAKGEPPTKEGK